jgi:hypothetical protein
LQIVELVYNIGADVPAAYYETSYNLLSFDFLLISPSKSLGLNLKRTQKRPVSVGYTFARSQLGVWDRKETQTRLIRDQTRLIRDPNETYWRQVAQEDGTYSHDYMTACGLLTIDYCL